MINIDISVNANHGMIGAKDVEAVVSQVLTEVSPLEDGDWHVVVNYKDHQTITISVMAVG